MIFVFYDEVTGAAGVATGKRCWKRALASEASVASSSFVTSSSFVALLARGIALSWHRSLVASLIDAGITCR